MRVPERSAYLRDTTAPPRAFRYNAAMKGGCMRVAYLAVVVAGFLASSAIIAASFVIDYAAWPSWVRWSVVAAMSCLATTISVRTSRVYDKNDWSRRTNCRRGLAVLISLLLVGACSVLFSGRPGAALLVLGFGVPCGIGVALIHMGKKRRVGSTRHCPKCDYPCLDAAGTEASRCPECGTEWLGKWILGDFVGKPHLRDAGIAVLATGVVILMGLARFNQGTSWTPTRVLLWQARYLTDDAGLWAEISHRTLTPAQADALAEGCLSRIEQRRTPNPAFPPFDPCGDWIGTQIVKQTLSEPARTHAIDCLARVEPYLYIPQGFSQFHGAGVRAYAQVLSSSIQAFVVLDSAKFDTDLDWTPYRATPAYSPAFFSREPIGDMPGPGPMIWLTKEPRNLSESIKVRFWKIAAMPRTIPVPPLPDGSLSPGIISATFHEASIPIRRK